MYVRRKKNQKMRVECSFFTYISCINIFKIYIYLVLVLCFFLACPIARKTCMFAAWFGYFSFFWSEHISHTIEYQIILLCHPDFASKSMRKRERARIHVRIMKIIWIACLSLWICRRISVQCLFFLLRFFLLFCILISFWKCP